MHKAGTKSSIDGRGVMKKRAVIWILILVVFIPPVSSAAMDKAAVIGRVSGLQMPFIENRGQIGDDSVRFYAKTFAGTVYVTERGEIVYSIVKTKPAAKNSIYGHIASGRRIKSSTSRAVALRERPVGFEKTGTEGGTVSPYPLGIHRSAARVNYFIGGKENWRTGIPTWREVSLGEVYNGIELRLRAYGKNVEKVFTVQPEGSVGDIRLEVEGADGLAVNREGELEIATALGTVKMTKPVAYQEIDGRRVEVAASYTISGRDRGLVYGFQVGEYDDTKPLVIDPLLASTFLGGMDHDYGSAIALDGTGSVYVTGSTSSLDFPTTPGAFDTDFGSAVNGFVSKFDNKLETLLASTFFGERFVYVNGITIDNSGNIYVVGAVWSPDFPTTPDTYSPTFNGGISDGFISRFDSELETLLASTFIGGAACENDSVDSIATDNDGNVYVAGWTECADFPTTPAAYDTTFNSGDVPGMSYSTAFVSKFDPDLKNLLASTFLGGSDWDYASSLAISAAGNVYVTGLTGASDFPVTPDAYDRTYNGGMKDAFVSEFDGNLEHLLASTLVGGDKRESSLRVAIDSGGNIYITGWTESSDFVTTPDAYDPTFNGELYDAFVAKFDSRLENLLASTFLGGSDSDFSAFLSIDGTGNVYVTGWTESADFPTTNDACDTTYDGVDSEAFVSKLDGDLSNLLASTFLGGTADDYASSLAIDGTGNVYVVGSTESSDFPTTSDAYDTTYGGEYSDAFISLFDGDLSSGHMSGRHRNRGF